MVYNMILSFPYCQPANMLPGTSRLLAGLARGNLVRRFFYTVRSLACQFTVAHTFGLNCSSPFMKSKTERYRCNLSLAGFFCILVVQYRPSVEPAQSTTQVSLVNLSMKPVTAGWTLQLNKP
jgi:hypothetical protein